MFKSTLQLTDRYTQCLTWVCKLHHNQRRKMHGEPYISHLLRVGGMVLVYAEDEEEAMAAILHDAAEDQGGLKTLTEIQTRFSQRTAMLVSQCSDTFQTPKPAWRPRKELYIQNAASADPAARRISCCDKLDNARDILEYGRIHGAEVFNFFQGQREGILWYFTSLLEVYRQDVPTELVNSLAAVVEQLKTL